MVEGDLRAAILDDPDDEGARRVYADWLGQRSRPGQAALIRIGLAVRRLRAWDPRRVALRVERRALDAMGVPDALLEALPKVPGVEWRDHDGVMAAASVPHFHLLVQAQDALRAQGVRAIQVAWPESVEQARQLQPIPGLRELYLTGAPRSAASVEAVAACPALHDLRALRVVWPLEADAVRTLLGAPWAEGLEELRLYESLGEGGFAALVEHDLPFLRELLVGGPSVPDAAHHLAGWASLDEVATLTLRGPEMMTEAIETLWGSPNLGSLRDLRLDADSLQGFPSDLGTSRIRLERLELHQGLSSSAAEALTLASSVESVRSLAMMGSPAPETEAALDVFAAAGTLRHLQRFHVTSASAAPTVVERVAAGQPERLHTLDVHAAQRSRRSFGDGAKALLDSPSRRLLRALTLRTPEGPHPVALSVVEPILESPRLELLDLGIGWRPSARREALYDHRVIQRLLTTGGLADEALGRVSRRSAA